MAPIQEAWGGPGRERQVDHRIDVDLLIKQAQTWIYQRRLRVREFFRDYDRFRCGRCTRQQFSRALSGICPSLRPQEMAALADRFTVDGPQVKWPINIDYVRFIEVVDEVFGMQGLESRPDVKVPKPGAALPCTGGFRPCQVDDEARAREVVRKLALLTRTRGVDLSDCYLYCQRTDVACSAHMRGSGKISRPMFLQRFPFLHDFSERDLDLLCKRFAAEHGTVDVHALVREVDVQAEPGSSAPSEATAAPPDAEAPGDDALEAEAEEELMDGLAPRRREDCLAGRRPAPVPASRRPSSADSLRRAVSASRLYCDGQGAEAPRQRSGPSRPSSSVGLRTSASFRAAAAAPSEKERALPPRPHSSAASTRDDLPAEVEDAEPLEAEAVEELRQQMPPQRRRSSSAASGVSRPGSAASRGSSARRDSWPANTAPAGRPSVNNPYSRRPSSASSEQEPWMQRRNSCPAASAPEDVLTKLRSVIAERRIRVTDCFQDFDRLRKGVCTFTSLRSALTLVGLELEPQDYDTLFDLFLNADGMFRYRDFCAEVSGEAIEVCVRSDGSAPMTATRFKANMDQKASSALEDLEAQLRRKAQIRRVELRSTFEHFCRARPGHVTRAQFARIMAMHGFRLTEEQCNAICRAYCDSQDPQELNFLMFCDSMERPRSQLNAGRFDGAATVPVPAGPQLTPQPPASAPRSRPSRPLSGYGHR